MQSQSPSSGCGTPPSGETAAPVQRILELEFALKARDKMIRSLLNRVMERQSHPNSSFDSLRVNASLQAVVARKTAELEAANAQLAAQIDERRRAEQERQRLEVSLAAAQKLEAIGQLAAGIAHEINTPTQYVGDNTRFVDENVRVLLELCARIPNLLDMCAAQQADSGVLDEVRGQLAAADLPFLEVEIPSAIQQSLEGVDRIATIVRAMKEFSHPGGQAMQLVDINHALDSTLTVGRSEWKYCARLETKFDVRLPHVPCFPSELNQVFLNLIVNASHAIKERLGASSASEGRLRVVTRQHGDFAVITVSDNGCGVKPENKAKIFEPFFTTKGVGRGTGQGLSMAYAVIVQKHKGTIEVESEVGRGTTFTIKLPLAAVATEPQQAA